MSRPGQAALFTALGKATWVIALGWPIRQRSVYLGVFMSRQRRHSRLFPNRMLAFRYSLFYSYKVASE